MTTELLPHPLRFEEIVDRLRRSSSSVKGPRLLVPSPAHPFVPQKTIVDQGPPELHPLDSDVLLFAAPAAVGKSTFARTLAATAGIPLLDLAKVPVSTHSLRGILSAEMGYDAPYQLQHGSVSLIIDALDEGRVLSGDKNFEEFLRTTFHFLLEDPNAPRGQGPKLLLFGRSDAVELTSILLELEAEEIPASQFTIDYFDQESATELVLEYARLGGREDKVQRYQEPIRETIQEFFKAISTAIGISAAGLWRDLQGRSFAGYAPVLAALGALIGETPNYPQLQQQLRATGPTDAWDVLEKVAREVLEREAGKVREPLSSEWGSEIPPQAYDPTDQLDLVAAHLAGQPLRLSHRLRFGSPAAAAAYREAIKTHLPEHPFLREDLPVNDVLGALIVAHAIASGAELSSGQAPSLLSRYGRQPFLWRFLRHRFPENPVIGGEMVPFVLGSLWSDEMSSSKKARILVDSESVPRLLIGPPNGSIALGVVTPLHLRGDVRDLTVEIPNDEVVLGGWPGADAPTIRFSGNTSISAETARFEIRKLLVGSLGTPSSSHLSARRVVNDEMISLEVQPNSALTVDGAFGGRYPWAESAGSPTRSDTDDSLLDLLIDCEQRLPGGIAVVVLQDYNIPEDSRLNSRMEWARKYGRLFPALLESLVEEGLASTDRIQVSGAPKMRIRPDFKWSHLRRAYENINSADERIRRVLTQMRADG